VLDTFFACMTLLLLIIFGSTLYHVAPTNRLVVCAAQVLGCGGPVQLSADRPTAIITSPNYPNSYVNRIDCTWLITAPPNRKVQLQFVGDIFRIESHARYVRREGDDDQSIFQDVEFGGGGVNRVSERRGGVNI